MKRKLSTLISSAVAILTILVLFAFALPQDQKIGGAWAIPAKYKTMKNTVKSDPASLNTGKMLYAKHCKSCHGGTGLGDGPKASSMKTKINSFKDAKFQAQSDGIIFYQISVGRDEMPGFDKKVSDDDDRWALVNFVRSLK